MAHKRQEYYRNRDRTHFFLVLPNLILYTVFSVFPILLGVYYSFTNWDGIRKSYQFIGLRNYIKMFSDKRFLNSVRFNIRYTILLVIGITILSLILGILLNKNLKGQSFFRSLYFFPAVISLLTSGLIFNQIFGRGLPFLGNALEIDILQKNILASKTLAMYGVLFVNIWQGVSIPTVLVISGLQTVPQELVEAASLDGASKWQIFKFLTMPFLLPTISMVIILTLKSGLMLYDYVVALTSGGPARATESLTMLIYTQAFDEMKFSYSIAESIVVSGIIILISILQIRSTNRKKVY